MNNDNASAWQKVSAKFLTMSQREQLLILISGLVALILLGYTFLIEPNLNQTNNLTKSILLAQSEQQKLAGQVVEIQNQFKHDPNIAIRERIDILNEEISTLDIQLQQQTDNLVPANQMASMLEKILQESKGIKLIELASISPTPIYLSKPSEDDKQPEPDLYRHGVQIVMQASYFDIQDYLQKLESLQWKFYWKKFDYKVDVYPNGQINLEIYTLSTNQAFIGV
ncbi:type II secretion system protein M [Paraglaciecola aquimarina]|uniref:Type II secretion system protein M n=1 Tax=Paraglaciecola algarum TaxID=3050085 RepID=A0ABS9D415_9ALTE|nr:type II secretion system protein GspM [Paraglaciecola sp. G1-23]MCF2947374.1 type II secretion system protein M [Paraglaciecola sp. G1-23]